MEYITIATTGNVTDFGDISSSRYLFGPGSTHLRGVFGGGIDSAASNVLEFITIATTGDVTDFGDLTVARYGNAGCSQAHGGLA